MTCCVVASLCVVGVNATVSLKASFLPFEFEMCFD